MKTLTASAALLGLVLLGLACSADKPPPDQQPRTAIGDKPSVAGSVSARPTIPMPIPPAGAQWTVYCATYSGAGHVLRAQQMREMLLQNSGLRDWYIVVADDHSTLYYGFYKAIEEEVDRREAARAKADHRKIQGLLDLATRRPLFRGSFLVSLETDNPPAPPEWDLRNAKGYWSLEIAAYKDSPERKQYAVDAVKEFRARGIEAYYYHGPVISSVCIGAWAEDAVKRQEAGSARTIDPTQTILVTDGSLPVPPDLRDARGNPIKVMQPVIEVLDPTMKKAMEDYPRHAVNGFEQKRRIRNARNEIVERYDPSFLVLIPQDEKAAGAGRAVEVEPPFPASVVNPQPTPPQGEGRLRTLGNGP